MSAQHTPGPWAYRPSNNGHFIAGTGENSGYLAEVRQCRSKQDIRADARLIAAAPEMLAALQAVLAEIDGPDRPHSTDSWLPSQLVLQVRVAIAKVEGGAA